GGVWGGETIFSREQSFLKRYIPFVWGEDNLISFLRPTGAKNTSLFSEGVGCGEGKPSFPVKRGFPLPTNHLPFREQSFPPVLSS
ncbi:MAG: hypothetical protein IKC89_05820, partial [Lentisphaeria bacterium]|nr:hypothetical protein [Lentisphaeria bacterium]